VRNCDVAVVGGGLAGLTAGMIAAQHGLSAVVIDPMGGAGQVLNVPRLDNVPGFPEGIAGYELGPLLQTQAMAAGCELAFDSAESLEPKENGFVLHCTGEEIEARSVIVAAGSSLRSLGIPGEEELRGKGVSNCASCDGPFHSGKTVAVIGGGDSAVEEAVILTDYARRVLLFHHGPELNAQAYLLEQAAAKPSIEISADHDVDAIVGEEAVTSIQVCDDASGACRVEEVSGVFAYVGLEPNTAFLRGVVDLDPAGHVVTDTALATSLPGVFAAGDIRQGSVSLAAAVMGDGATAAVSAYRYLNRA
jgi:thioredoxin reductase (NADPH)